jgi:2-C-methyl-D-erythritol 4-phosphate cytidylyltransferase
MKYIKENLTDTELIIYHVANRPLVSDCIIDSVVDTALESGDVVAAAVECSDAIAYADVDYLTEIVTKRKAHRLQAPYAMTIEQIEWCESEMKKQNITDSQTLFTLYIELGRRVRKVDGEEQNIRLTHQSDLAWYTKIAQFIYGENKK